MKTVKSERQPNRCMSPHCQCVGTMAPAPWAGSCAIECRRCGYRIDVAPLTAVPEPEPEPKPDAVPEASEPEPADNPTEE